MGVDAIGRRDEVARLTGILAAVAGGGLGHVVELGGDAGVGKSTVLSTVLAHADATGWRVFRAAPTAAEAAFPWTGLAQLAPTLRRDVRDPAVAAYLANVDAAVSGARTGPVEPELVAFGLAGLLDSFRDPATPFLLAIDDYHWLDAASAGAIAYALRGAATRRGVVMLAHRTGEPRPFEPERVVAPEHLSRIELAGLSLASLREIIAAATGVTFGRAELAQLHQRTNGNPLYAVELARMVVSGVPLDAAALPESLRATVGQRVAALPVDTRRVLGAAALTVHPVTDLLTRALPGIDVVAAVAPAEAAAVAYVRRTSAGQIEIGFRHPLLAAAALDSLTTEQRRALHAALAAAVADPVERAGHLAADLRADAALAAQLESAAREASARGAADAAVEIAGSAVSATPPDDDPVAAIERRYLHAELALHAGRLTGLTAHVAALRADASALAERTGDATGRDLAERTALLQAYTVTAVEGSGPGAAAAERLLDDVSDPNRRVRLHTLLVRATQHHDVARAAVIADEVFGPQSEYQGWDALLGAALLAMARVAAGDPVDLDALVARADAEDLTAEQRAQLLSMLTEVHVWTDHPGATAVSEVALARMERTGNRSVYLSELMYLGQHLFVRGAFDRAEDVMLQIQEYSGEFLDSRQARADLALLRAAQGHAEAALRLLDAAAARPDDTLEPTEDLWVACAAGSVAHALGRPEAADLLLAAEAMAIGLGIHAVRGLHIRRDLVESLVAANRLDEARAALDRLTVDAARNDVPTAQADADAAAGVVAAAGGDHTTARACFARAAEVQRAFDVRYELARTLLAAGSAARRAGSRSEAGTQLDAAQALFEAMGARLWSQRCAQELERIPGRRPTGETTELTPTERQVAEQVAAGRTNAEIAAALFVTVSTVESNLTRTYRKLGLRSRTELARHINGAG